MILDDPGGPSVIMRVLHCARERQDSVRAVQYDQDSMSHCWLQGRGPELEEENGPLEPAEGTPPWWHFNVSLVKSILDIWLPEFVR